MRNLTDMCPAFRGYAKRAAAQRKLDALAAIIGDGLTMIVEREGRFIPFVIMTPRLENGALGACIHNGVCVTD